MGVGVIGMGNLGTTMVQRLMKGGHQCVVYDADSVSVHTLASEIPVEATSLGEFVNMLTKPRAIWMMMPEAAFDATLGGVVEHLDSEDVIIGGGKSHYRDDLLGSSELKTRGIHYVDFGSISATTAELQRNSMATDLTCKDQTNSLCKLVVPVPGSEMHVPGRGSFGGSTEARRVSSGQNIAASSEKMINSGIKYGLLATYTEEMNIHHRANAVFSTRDKGAKHRGNRELIDFDVSLVDTGEIRRRGRVVSSWLVDLAANALLGCPGQKKFTVRVSDSREGRWTVVAAIEESSGAPVLAAALYERFGPRGEAEFTKTVLSDLRVRLEGHLEEPSIV